MSYAVYAQEKRADLAKLVSTKDKRAEAVALIDGLVQKRGFHLAYLVTDSGRVTYRRSNQTYAVADGNHTILVKRDHAYLLVASGGLVREFYPPSNAAFELYCKRHRHNSAPNGLPWLFHHALSVTEVNDRIRKEHPE